MQLLERVTSHIASGKEAPMTEHSTQYESIGSKYDEYAHTATLKGAECYTFFRMVGALEGKRVLDVACGCGFYTRLLKHRGAAQVTGIDISPEMIRLAYQHEQAEPLDITYQVGDAVTLPPLAPLIWSRRSICSPTRQARTSCEVCSGASTTTSW
jgi:2-polyprenyl-3-methyl-5-hydroxy-6-metoxy-1,4-benzoquinol methylase